MLYQLKTKGDAQGILNITDTIQKSKTVLPYILKKNAFSTLS